MSESEDNAWRAWGGALREHRRLAGKTQSEAGRAAAVSRQMIGHFEKGIRRPNREHAEALDAVLATGGLLTQMLGELNGIREIPRSWRDFILLEREAYEIREYQLALVPGLIQAPLYAKQLLLQGPSLDSHANIEDNGASRLERLEKLPHAPTLWFVIEEPVLRRGLGTAQVMREQLDYIIRLIEERRVRVACIPGHAPHRPAVAGSFRLMTLAQGRSVVHLEHLLGETLVEDVAQVRQCLAVFTDLQSEALSPAASLDLIKDVRKDFD